MCSKIVAALMAGSVGMCLGADAARALDLRDRNIWIATQRVYEAVDNPSKPPYVDRSKSGQNFRLVAGKIVSFGEYEGGCNQWLVYTPGRPSSGTVECKPKREGVSSDWTERSAIATFQTQFVGAGNVPTLKGEMKGSTVWRMNHCHRIFGNSKTDFTITETLKVRVTGETCQVLAVSAREARGSN